MWNTQLQQEAEVPWATDSVVVPEPSEPDAKASPKRRGNLSAKNYGPKLVSEKRQATESDLARFGPDLIEIFSLNDKRKRAKTELIAAQTKYEDVCSALQGLKERMLNIFDDLNQDEA